MHDYKLEKFVSTVMVKLLTVILLGTTSMCTAATYYVSTTGSDSSGNGSQSSPWRTVAYASSNVTSSGNLIYVNAGTYTESNNIELAPGVSLEGAGEDITIIRPTETAPDSRTNLIRLYSSSMTDGNQTLSNFTVDGRDHALTRGIDFIKRSYITMHHVTVKDCHWSAFRIYGDLNHGYGTDDWPSRPNSSYYASNIIVKYCSFENSGRPIDATWDYGCVNWETVRDSMLINCYIDETEYSGFGAKFWQIDNCVFANNVVRVSASDPNRGKDFAFESWMMYKCYFINNDVNGGLSLIYNVGSQLSFNRIIHYPGEERGYGLEWSGTDVRIDHNYIKNASFGLVSWHCTNWDSIASNNVIVDAETAILIDSANSTGHTDNYLICNNTIDSCTDKWNNGPLGFRIQDAAGSIDATNIKNNIISNSHGSRAGITLAGLNGGSSYAYCTTDTTISYNLFYNNASGDISDLGAVNTSIFSNLYTNPSYTTSESDIYYYGLASGSAAREAGDDVGLPYLGSDPDIGAHVQLPYERMEAEMNYSTANDTDGDITHVNANLSSEMAIRCPDANDVLRIHFYLPEERTLRLNCRVKSGYSGDYDAYFAAGCYTYKLDFEDIDFTGNTYTISDYDSSNGGIYWGTMSSDEFVTMSAGQHILEISGSISNKLIDYFEFNTGFLEAPLNAGSGLPVDLSSFNNTPVMYNTTWTTDGHNNTYGIKFDAYQDQLYYTGSVANALSAGSHWEIEAWIKINSAPSWRKIIASQENYNTNGFRWGINSNGYLVFWTTQSGGDINVTATSNAVPVGQWTKVCVEYISGTVKMYVNDVQVAQAYGTYLRSTAAFKFGYCGGIENFDGVIDDIKVLKY